MLGLFESFPFGSSLGLFFPGWTLGVPEIRRYVSYSRNDSKYNYGHERDVNMKIIITLIALGVISLILLFVLPLLNGISVELASVGGMSYTPFGALLIKGWPFILAGIMLFAMLYFLIRGMSGGGS